LKDKGNKCLAEYVKDQTYCGDKHKDIKSKSYGFCVDDATTDLEACALMELIEEHEFKKFHVDVTAWLHFKGVVMARAQAESLYKASRETLAKVSNPKDRRVNKNQVNQWKHYVQRFKVIDESVDHELEIAIWREAIELAATKDASARNELDKLAAALVKHKAERDAKKKLYHQAVQRYTTASAKLKEAKKTVSLLLKEKKSIEVELEELHVLYKKASEQEEHYEESCDGYENKLKELILKRERKPVGAMKPGYEIHFWNSKVADKSITNHNNNNNWRKYEAFNFETTETEKMFVLPDMQLASNHQFRNALRPKIGQPNWDGQFFLMKVVGVFVAPEDDTYTFSTDSDDGSYLYFGQHALDHGRAVVNNGGAHGMRHAKGHMKMFKGMEQQFVLTFWQHIGGAGLKLNIRNSKGQIVNKPMHYESGQQRWYEVDKS